MPNPDATRLAEAIDRLVAGDWPAAHRLVQDLDDPMAWRIHALVQRMEGDLENSRYWYDKAGAAPDEKRSVEDEIDELRNRLKSSA